MMSRKIKLKSDLKILKRLNKRANKALDPDSINQKGTVNRLISASQKETEYMFVGYNFINGGL